jgi:MoaA/NifB/PqqE/SkfB family radical SAM enzyme
MNARFLEESDQWVAHHVDPSLPTPDVIQLELTAACDLACIMCPLPHETRHGAGADLDRERPFFAAASGVELTGFGEILCHPQLVDCLRWFRSLGLAVAATTNGQRLTPEIIDAIVGENLVDVLCVSVDAAAASTYERIRRHGDFRRLRRNLQTLSTRRANGPLRLFLSFAAMEPNIRELPDFIRWAAELGVDRVVVQHVFEGPHTRGLGLQHHRDLARRLLDEAGALADELGVALDGRNLYQHGAVGRPDNAVKACPFPWSHTFVKANRRVAACAMVWEDLDFGDLSGGLEQVWRGENYRRFREAMAGTAPPEPCVRCQYFGWREAQILRNVGSSLTMESAQRGQLGMGWHAMEKDARGRSLRWSRAQASTFLRATGPILEIDAVVHPDAPFLRGRVCVNDVELPFDSHDLWGEPLRLAVGESANDVARVEVLLDEAWNPGAALGIAGPRKLGLLVYGMSFDGDAAQYTSTVDARDARKQLCRGWLSLEEAGGRPARWTREIADLVLRADGRELVVEAMAPVGLSDRTVRALCDGAPLGELRIAADGQWRSLRFTRPSRVEGLRRVEIRIDDAMPAPNDHSPHPRRFGLLISRIGFAD